MKILFADDHPLFREGVKPVLRKLDAVVEITEANDYPGAFEAMRTAGEVDLALLDLFMPGMEGIEGITRFRSTFPDTPVVVLSGSEEVEDIQMILGAGALGYITKASSTELILSAMRLILAGGVYVPPKLYERGGNGHAGMSSEVNPAHSLTSRQIEVLRELSKGRSNKQIADALRVTEGTIKIHLASIFRILKVTNRTEAVLMIQKLGLDH